MAIFNFRVNHLTQRSGHAARQVARYFLRTDEYAPKEVDYLQRRGADTVEYGDFVEQRAGNLPPWAQEDARIFFAKAEALERGGPQRAGRWATTWQIALPQELTREEQWTMGTAFIDTQLTHHAYLCVMHDPVTDGQHQPHLHVIFSERTTDDKTRDAVTYFRRPEVGGCAKDRWLSQRASVAALREAWADWTNYTLERAGHPARVHPRSLYARNIARKPEPKVGYSTNADLHAERARIRAARDVAKEQALAARGWEARKTRLGIADIYTCEPVAFLRNTYTRSRQHSAGTWHRDLAARKAQEPWARAAAHLAQESVAVDKAIGALEAQLRLRARMAGREDAPRRGRLHVTLYEEDGYGR